MKDERLIDSDDVRHGLKEVAALELVKDGHKKGISVSCPDPD